MTECALPALAGLVAGGLRLQVTLGRPAEALLERLTAGETDLVLSTIRPDQSDLALTRLPDEEFVLVASPQWACHIDSADLDGPPVIAVSDSMPVIRRYWLAVYGTEPPGPPAVTVHDLRAVMSLVRQGAGITVLPRYLCREQLALGQLVDLVQPPVAPSNALFLATRGETSALDDLRAVHDRLVQDAESW